MASLRETYRDTYYLGIENFPIYVRYKLAVAGLLHPKTMALFQIRRSDSCLSLRERYSRERMPRAFKMIRLTTLLKDYYC